MNRLLIGIIIMAAAMAQQPGDGPVSIPAQSMDVRVAVAPANTAATYVDLVVDASASGGSVIDVVSSNPGAQISLILPSSAEVTPASAGGLGFMVWQRVIDPNSPPALTGVTPFESFGAHTTFLLPANSMAGTYRVKANTTGVQASSRISANYISLSGVKVGLAKNKAAYSIGENVILTAAVFGGAVPVTGATLTAKIVPFVSVNAQATVGGFQLVSQITSGNLTRLTYQASLTNTGAALPEASAKVTALPAGATLVSGGSVGFLSVPANGSIASINTFAIQVPAGQSFNPALLSWEIEAPGTSITIPMNDSGPFDYAASDGLYTGVYQPSVAGRYQVLADVTGTFGGAPFSRTSTSTFRVIAGAAVLNSVTDVAVDDNSNGLPERVVLTAHLNAPSTGIYRFNVVLSASNGKKIGLSGASNLVAGPTQISINVSQLQLQQLGVNGPYQKLDAAIIQLPLAGDPIRVAFLADAGSTAAYSLASFDRGALYFTGPNSAAGIGSPTFNLLRITMGVSNASARSCNWSATLSTQADVKIEFKFAHGMVPAGAASLTLDFSGPKIFRAGNGPYLVRNAHVQCRKQPSGVDQTGAVTLFQTQAFTASQFTATPADFVLALTSTPPAGISGSVLPYKISVTSLGGFEENVALSAGAHHQRHLSRESKQRQRWR